MSNFTNIDILHMKFSEFYMCFHNSCMIFLCFKIDRLYFNISVCCNTEFWNLSLN